MATPVSLINPPPTGHITVEAAGHRIHREFGGGQQLTQLDGLLQRGIAMLMLRLPEGCAARLHHRPQVRSGGTAGKRLAELVQSELFEDLERVAIAE